MAKLYGKFYEKIWKDALLLGGQTDLFISLASEIAKYEKIEIKAAKQKMMGSRELSRKFTVTRKALEYYRNKSNILKDIVIYLASY